MTEDSLLRGQMTKDELGDPDEITPIPFINEIEEIGVEAGALLLYTRDVSADAIYDVSTYDTAYWEGTYAESPTIQRVINPNNTFIEHFLDDLFNDSSVTTAAWGTTGTLTFGIDQQYAISNPVYLNVQNIYKATITVIGTTEGTYYLSNDGGTSWEEVDLGIEHTFSSVGNDLRFKISNASGSNPFPIPFGTWGIPALALSITQVKIAYVI